MSQQLVPGFESTTHQNQWIWSSPHLAAPLTEVAFDLAVWQAQGGVEPAAGRGSACRIPQPQTDWFLRHYRRGGLIGKLLHDQYWWRGAAATRVVREINVTQRLYELGLPVPKVVGGRLLRNGCIYRCDLITEALPSGQSMAELLPGLGLDEWAQLGETIAAFHQQGLWHADLNAHNILLGEGPAKGCVWVIDFDRAQFRTPATKWQQANLQRLWRSICKLAGSDVQHQANWQQFLSHYNAKISA